jgi:hypothetical protein
VTRQNIRQGQKPITDFTMDHKTLSSPATSKSGSHPKERAGFDMDGAGAFMSIDSPPPIQSTVVKKTMTAGEWLLY